MGAARPRSAISCHVYALTARDRYMVERELTPRLPPRKCAGFWRADERCGVLFGPERTGLVNDHIALADTVLTVPLNPAFALLNLAQAVLLVGYEWFTAQPNRRPRTCIPATAGRPTRQNCCGFSIISRRRWTKAVFCAIPTSARA